MNSSSRFGCAVLFGITTLLAGCSAHDCTFENDEQKATFEELAPMTKGAAHCDVSSRSDGGSGESHVQMGASHYDAKVDGITAKYEGFLKEKGWEVQVKDYEGKRANGNPLQGKMVLARKDGRKLGTTIYELTDGIVETTTMEVASR